MADLVRQGSLAEHANTHARRLVDSWVVRGAVEDSGDDEEYRTPAEARAQEEGRAKDGSSVVVREVGGSGGGEMEKDRPESLGLLLALCGLDADAKVLLGGYMSPVSWLPLPWPLRGGAAAAAPAAAGDTTAGVTDAEGARRSKDAILSSEHERGEERTAVAVAAEEEKKNESEANGLLDPSCVPLTAVTKITAAGNADADAFAAPAAGTPSAEYSALDYSTDTEAGPAAAAVEAGDAARFARRKQHEEEEERDLERRQHPTVPAAVYFDDEADFLEKSASEYAELMAGQEEEEEYLSGFSFAPPSFAAAKAPPSPVEGGRGAEGMSEGEQFRQLQKQRRGQVGLNEASLRPLPPPGAVDWPAEGQRVVLAPAGTTSTGSGGSSREPPRPLSAAREEEPCIVRRANLLDGGQTVVLVDVETTGLSAKTDRIIQLAGKVYPRGLRWSGVGKAVCAPWKIFSSLLCMRALCAATCMHTERE